MAVVFISPKQKQKMFFVVITAGFLVFLVVVFFIAFVSKPQETASPLVFNKAKVNIDFKVFDSEQFKSLVPFTDMETVYNYKGSTEDGEVKTGFVSATSEERAREMVADLGLSVIDLKEVEIGRENPFTPYYETVFTPPTQE